MYFDLNKLVRKNILNLKPYSSARDEFSGTASVFLDANENPLGSALPKGLYNRYPDPLQKEIKKILAEMEGVLPTQIFLGNGSDEAIDLPIRAFCEPYQDKILICPPTYGMYKVSADINAVTAVEVPLNPDFQLDTDKILTTLAQDSHIKIVFICSPNNPSGNLFSTPSIEAILLNFNGLVIIDEAYIDFCPPDTTWVKQLNKYPNLLIMKTFSKAWGLAGLRLGMAFGSEEIIKVLNKVKPPYNISSATQELALQALNHWADKQTMVQEILAQRALLINGLAKNPLVLKIYPSDANFILAKVSEPYQIYDYLVENEIIVRQRANVQLCEGCLRITVGTQVENKTLLNALSKFS
jgi:histidinol-phosphate aminotransferase